MNRRLLLSAAVAVAATVAGGYTLLGRNKSRQAPAAPAAEDPVAALMQLQLPVDQAINERDFAWIHVSYGPRNRRHYLALR